MAIYFWSTKSARSPYEFNLVCSSVCSSVRLSVTHFSQLWCATFFLIMYIKFNKHKNLRYPKWCKWGILESNINALELFSKSTQFC